MKRHFVVGRLKTKENDHAETREVGQDLETAAAGGREALAALEADVEGGNSAAVVARRSWSAIKKLRR